jgi:hypothetical protein
MLRWTEGKERNELAWTQEPKNSMKETCGPYINYECNSGTVSCYSIPSLTN